MSLFKWPTVILIKQSRRLVWTSGLSPYWTFPPTDYFSRNTQEFLPQRRHKVLAQISFHSNHLLCTNSRVRNKSVPIERQWLALVCNWKEKQFAPWSLSLLEASLVHATFGFAIFSFACVVPPTITNTFDTHYRGPPSWGIGWGRLPGWLSGRY